MLVAMRRAVEEITRQKFCRVNMNSAFDKALNSDRKK